MKVKKTLKNCLFIFLNLFSYYLLAGVWSLINLLCATTQSYEFVRLTAIVCGVALSVPLIILSARTLSFSKCWLLSLPIQFVLLLLPVFDYNAEIFAIIFYICYALIPCIIQTLGISIQWLWSKIV